MPGIAAIMLRIMMNHLSYKSVRGYKKILAFRTILRHEKVTFCRNSVPGKTRLFILHIVSNVAADALESRYQKYHIEQCPDITGLEYMRLVCISTHG